MAKKAKPVVVVSDDDKLNQAYNDTFKKGLEIGDWVVKMLGISNAPFIIPVNPHDPLSTEAEEVCFNGWRDGFDEALAQYMELEDVTIHEIMLNYSKRRYRT